MILQECCLDLGSASGSGTASLRGCTSRSLNTRRWSVWVGAHAFIMPGANIGEDVVVSAGSVVRGKGVESDAIVAGNPALGINSRCGRVVGDYAAGTPPGPGTPGN